MHQQTRGKAEFGWVYYRFLWFILAHKLQASLLEGVEHFSACLGLSFPVHEMALLAVVPLGLM